MPTQRYKKAPRASSLRLPESPDIWQQIHRDILFGVQNNDGYQRTIPWLLRLRNGLVRRQSPREWWRALPHSRSCCFEAAGIAAMEPILKVVHIIRQFKTKKTLSHAELPRSKHENLETDWRGRGKSLFSEAPRRS
jgi:hypothetical protein